MCHGNRYQECVMVIGPGMCHGNKNQECVMAIGTRNVSWQ